MRAANRKQALVPDGATMLEPVGTAPGLVVPPLGGPADRARAARARRASCSRCGRPRWRRTRCGRRSPGRASSSSGCCGSSGSRSRRSRGRSRCSRRRASPLDPLEITTCLRRGEIEIATVFEPEAAEAYARFVEGVRGAPRDVLFSEDGSTVDEQVARCCSAAGDDRRDRRVVHGRAAGRRG